MKMKIRRKIRYAFAAVAMLMTSAFVASAFAERIDPPKRGNVVIRPISADIANLTHQFFPVCYNFGCSTRITTGLLYGEWESVVDWFRPPARTPAQERIQIQHAVAWMERLVGKRHPTHKDLAVDLPPAESDPEIAALFPGQLDCIDEASNTTTYLKLFAAQGLLRHHEVAPPAYRRSLLDQHWAGQVREIASGRKFVIDSWFQANGYLPSVTSSERWGNISILTAVVENSHDGNDGIKSLNWDLLSAEEQNAAKLQKQNAGQPEKPKLVNPTLATNHNLHGRHEKVEPAHDE